MESSSDGKQDPGNDESNLEDDQPPTVEVGGVTKASTAAALDEFDFDSSLVNATDHELLSLREDDMTLMDSDIAEQIRTMVRKSDAVDLGDDESDPHILSIFQERFMRPLILQCVHRRYEGIGGSLPADDNIWKSYMENGMLPNFEQPLEPWKPTMPYKRPRRTKAQVAEDRARDGRDVQNA